MYEYSSIPIPLVCLGARKLVVVTEKGRSFKGKLLILPLQSGSPPSRCRLVRVVEHQQFVWRLDGLELEVLDGRTGKYVPAASHFHRIYRRRNSFTNIISNAMTMVPCRHTYI